jgi:hypothetical protein
VLLALAVSCGDEFLVGLAIDLSHRFGPLMPVVEPALSSEYRCPDVKNLETYVFSIRVKLRGRLGWVNSKHRHLIICLFIFLRR